MTLAVVIMPAAMIDNTAEHAAIPLKELCSESRTLSLEGCSCQTARPGQLGRLPCAPLNRPTLLLGGCFAPLGSC